MKLYRKIYGSLLALLILTSSICLAAGGDELIEAARKGDQAKVIELLDQGVDVNFAPFPMNHAQISSALTVAIYYDHGDVVQVLLKRGADVNQFGQGNGTPLMHASLKGKLELIKDLKSRGADVNLKNPGAYGGMTALHWASDHFDVVKFLVEAGANIDEENDAGATPLIYATQRQNLEAVRLLLKKGASVSPRVKPAYFAPSYVGKSAREIAQEILEMKAASNPELKSQGIAKDIVDLLIEYEQKLKMT
jgi:ankyrin repeat protein